jgi:hypothetical protein
VNELIMFGLMKQVIIIDYVFYPIGCCPSEQFIFVVFVGKRVENK